ncbi:MAG: ISL3 family transposase [Candidatus Hydrogenedentes bacterium]|nr:ISL3 family transposase [Candidatus Hydrogenedentota bacterium]
MKDTDLYAALLRLRHPWRVREVKLDIAVDRIDVWIEHAPDAKWCCPECGKAAPLYDHGEEREWRHLDTCDCQTFVHARPPRVKCPDHGVRQIGPTWANPGSHFTLRFERLVIDTLKECDVTGATRLTRTSWDEAWAMMEKAVARGMARKKRRIPKQLSIDEKAFAKRHRYETLVCDLDRGTVEYVVDDRQQESLETYYRRFTEEELAGVEAIAMDMWDPYIAATKAYVPGATGKIVFDKFHVIRAVTEAVDKVRRGEHKDFTLMGDERLKGTKHLWLANEENVPEWRKTEFDLIKHTNLKTSRAWAIKESLRKFWEYSYPARAEAYFLRWYFWATHSRLAPIIKAAKTIKVHLPNILTYFKHRMTNAVAEGLNSKIQMVKETACGFRNRDHYKTAIYFHCGGLDLYPELVSALP